MLGGMVRKLLIAFTRAGLLFAGIARGAPAPEEQAVVVHFAYGSTDFGPVRRLEAQLEAVLAKTGTGDLAGDELAVDGRDGYLYLYGPDADTLFAAVRPTLEATPFMKGANIRKVYGNLGTDVRREELQLAH